MSKKTLISLIILIYIAVGIAIAVQKHYLTLAILKMIASVLLAIVLWWLVLLGIDLHLH